MDPNSNRNDTHTNAVVNAEANPTAAYAAEVAVLIAVSNVSDSNWKDMACLTAVPPCQKRPMKALMMRSTTKKAISPAANGTANSTEEYMNSGRRKGRYLYNADSTKWLHVNALLR
jgi:hypothetical protein